MNDGILISKPDVHQSSIASEECKRQRLSLNGEPSFKEEPNSDMYTSVADTVKKPAIMPDFHSMAAASGSAGMFPFDFGGIPSIHDHLRYAEAFAR